MTALDHLASVWLERLAWTSLQATLLVAAVVLLIRVLPRLPAAVCCALWWLVGLQALLGLCWQAPIRLPLLAPMTVAEAPVTAVQTDVGIYATRPDHGVTHRTITQAVMSTSGRISQETHDATMSRWFVARWRTILVAAWLLLLLLQLPKLTREYIHTYRLRSTAKKVTDDALLAHCARQANMLGLRRAPIVLASNEIDSPQVSGNWRPVVLWSAHNTLSADEASLALAHELAHLKRGDLLLGWIPTLAAHLFFFHPLLRWAMREYALHREAACDALAVQQQHVAPQDYGRLLLRLGVAHPMHATLAGASPTFLNLKRRLAMLQLTTTTERRVSGWLLVVLVALAGVLPYRVVAANQSAHSAVTQDGAKPSMVVPPAPPVPPPPPRPAQAASNYSGARNVHTHIDPNAHEGFALFDGDTVIINGTAIDEAAAKLQHTHSAEPTLWLRRGDQAYLVHDPAMIKRAEAISTPVSDYWRNAGRLEGKMWAIKGPMEGLRDWQASVQSQRKALLADPDAPAYKERLASLNSQQKDIAGRMAKFQHELAALQPQIDSMRRQQLATSGEANRRISELIDDAITQGKAMPVSHIQRP